MGVCVCALARLCGVCLWRASTTDSSIVTRSPVTSAAGEPESPVAGHTTDAAQAISDDAVAVAACEHAGLLRGEDPVFTNVDAAYRSPTGTFIRGHLSGTSYVLAMAVAQGVVW
jgi:hypothetical protein